MFNMPAEGMHDVDTRWKGMSATYEVSMDDGYSYDNVKVRSDYEYETKMPNGLLHQTNDEQVVPFSGADGPISLPPLKTSTGLRANNVMTNPHLDQRDASYVYSDDCYSDTIGSMFPNYDTSSEPMPHDSFAPESYDNPWQLGEKDMMSMFNDYYHDGYVAELDRAVETAYQFSELDGVFNPNYEEAFSFETYVQPEADLTKHQDDYMTYMYEQTKQSEEWTENELQDVTYHWLHEACTPADVLPSDVNLTDCTFEWASEPEIVMVADAMGKSTPMACGVMVVAGSGCGNGVVPSAGDWAG